MAELKAGDRAPDFTLPSQDGSQISLHDYQGRKNVVIYFYPRDFTQGCTTETKGFGSEYGRIKALDSEVLGISSDGLESHARFRAECGADFPLLSDAGGTVRKAYGVKASLGVVPGRVTFVVDKRGVILKVFSSQLLASRHPKEAMDALIANGSSEHH